MPTNSPARRAYLRLRWEWHKLTLRRRITRSHDVATGPNEPAIVFFAPEASLTPLFAAHCLVARTLRERGHRVLFARCRSLYGYCTVMDSRELPLAPSRAIREQTCIACAESSLAQLEAYGLEAFDLATLVTPELTRGIDAVLAAAPESLLDLTIDGIPYGRLSAMSLVLREKVSDFSRLTADQRTVWLHHIRNALTSFRLVDRLVEKIPVKALVHYNDYAILLGARLAAERRGVRCLTISHASHMAVDRRRITMLGKPGSVYADSPGKLWPGWRDLPLPAAVVSDIGDDLLLRFRGGKPHVYSPARTPSGGDLRKTLALDENRRLVVAFTSSLDEMVATRMVLDTCGVEPARSAGAFSSQIEWLRATVDHVEKSRDLQLVVRVHPREAANKREHRVSQHLGALRAAFPGPFRHCRFVWPEERVSSYDLAELADAALVSWSTVGVELARAGIPVLSALHGGFSIAQDDFMELASSPGDYLVRLERLAHGSSASLETIARAFRWHHLLYIAPSVDFSDVVPSHDFDGLPDFRLPREAATVEAIVAGKRGVLEINRERLERSRGTAAVDGERVALRATLRRIVGEFLGAPQDGWADWHVCRRDEVTWRLNGSLQTRRSPLCARLVPLLAERDEGREMASAGVL